MIYAFLNQKGGVGKTTLSIHLADALARRGRRVLGVDADPIQQSFLEWAGYRAEQNRENRFNIVGKATPHLHKELPPISSDYDDVVIDGPPRVMDVAKAVILAADLVIIPVQPCQADVSATIRTIALIQEASVFKETLKSAIAVNRKIVNTAIGQAIRETLAELQTPVLTTDICGRTIFSEVFGEGRTAYDKDHRSNAAQEIEALVDEIMRTYVKEDNYDRTAGRRVATGR
jgi:chromosome partitioning protein